VAAGIVNCDDPERADVVLVGANYDRTSSFGKGANRGPAAIVQCLNTQIEFLERATGTSPADELSIAYVDLGDLNELAPEAMVERVRDAYLGPYAAGKFTVVLGGEHSVANGPFQAVAARQRPEDVTIVYLDAHLDMRDTDADYNDQPFGKYAHSCVLHRGVELGFRAVHVGARAFSEYERDFARQHGVPVFEWGVGPVPSVEEVLGAVATEQVYVSIDVDGFDPAHMPATGTPVAGGIEWHYGLRLLRELCAAKTVLGADVVEVAPRPGERLTEYGAAQLVYSLIAYRQAARRSV
jgi:agmatinase